LLLSLLVVGIQPIEHVIPSNKEVEGSIGIRRRTLKPLIIVPRFGQEIDWLLK
jgi:hypothetical protein